MSNYPHTPTREGFKCPISGKVFPAADHSRKARRIAFHDQQKFTSEIIFDLGNRHGNNLSIADMTFLYAEANNE